LPSVRVAYVPLEAPWGPGEEFVVEEALALAGMEGVAPNGPFELLVVPAAPRPGDPADADRRRLVRMARNVGKYSPTSWALAFAEALEHPMRALRSFGRILVGSGSLRALFDNILIFPKALATARILRGFGAEHIHAHWANVPSTVAYVAHRQTGIPWSFTCHRYDISEGNLLREKVLEAAFVRAIAEDGRAEILARVGKEQASKVRVLHMGVRLPLDQPEDASPGPRSVVGPDEAGPARTDPSSPPFAIACPANLVAKKGHRFLLEALALLRREGIRVEAHLFRTGPLEAALREQAARLGIEGQVLFRGTVPHAELLHAYQTGAFDAAVLPSIVTPSGEREGIPVALMEAMAYGVPVVSTTTGGIPELVAAGCGILVPPEDATALAFAIRSLASDPLLRARLGQAGRKRVEAEFSLDAVSRSLRELFARAAPAQRPTT
jgi:glycosyltransferase involved in cell wall biosynthesis